MIKSIYIDTSVFGGYFDEEFEEYSKKFFNKIEETNSIILLSDVALDELVDSPQRVKDFVNSISEQKIERIFLNEESKELALKYIEEKGSWRNKFSGLFSYCDSHYKKSRFVG